LRVQSAIRGAIQTITKTIQVAAGVFGPGHLGELAWQVPFELVDAVLAETLATQRRLRELPSRVGVYYVLAFGLFPGLGYQRVWAKLTAALPDQGLPSPSAKALRDLRQRIGPAPLKALLEVLAGPVVADELCLAPGPLQRHDGVARSLCGNRSAVVTAHDVPAQVQPGSHAGRGQHAAFVDEENTGIDLDGRMQRASSAAAAQ
jgi:hypothetical protein